VAQGTPHKLQEDQVIATEAVTAMPRFKELRRATRYQLPSAAVIRWLGADEKIHEAFGAVRDISTFGVFIESTTQLRLNTNVELDITPPSLQPNASGPELHIEGKVVRTETRPGKQGFAVAGFLSVSRFGGPVC
jgi:PilZ domain-containing protein